MTPPPPPKEYYYVILPDVLFFFGLHPLPPKNTHKKRLACETNVVSRNMACETNQGLSIGYTLKARLLSDLFNRAPKARGE